MESIVLKEEIDSIKEEPIEDSEGTQQGFMDVNEHYGCMTLDKFKIENEVLVKSEHCEGDTFPVADYLSFLEGEPQPHLEEDLKRVTEWDAFHVSNFSSTISPQKHPTLSKDLVSAISGGSKRGRLQSGSSADTKDSKAKRIRQGNIQSSFAVFAVSSDSVFEFNNNAAQELFLRCMVEEMLPAKFTESTSLATFLKYLNPNFQLPSTTTYVETLKKRYEAGMAELTAILEEVRYVATTVDCWTSHNRSFIGMTAHWISVESSTLKRKKAILTCKELSVQHSYDVLANYIQDVLQKFHIEGKVTDTTTDNGSNFVKTFKVYGVFDKDSDEDPIEEEEEDDIEGMEDVEPVHLAQLIEDEEQMDSDAVWQLPNHHRCVAHTLNLLATVDVERVPNWSVGSRACFTKVKGKAQALWNKHNRKPSTAATMKRKVGRLLKTPNMSRWSSLYDSMAVLLEVLNTKMTQINMICMDNNIATFNQTDKEVIREYLSVMEPVVISIDKLQSEKEAYMGVLLPALYVLRDKLEAMRTKSLKYAGPLLDYLLDNPLSEEKRPKGFKARFSHLFDDMDLLLATTIHPLFKLPVVRHLNKSKADHVRSRLLEEVKETSTTIDTSGTSSIEEEEEEGDDYFKVLRLKVPLQQQTVQSSSDVRLSNKIAKELDNWCSEKENNNKELKQGMFPALCRAAWVDVFCKYNTGIPSSAAVEKLFSQGSDIMEPKRASLASKNFERLVFLKGNMDLLKIHLHMNYRDPS